MLWNLTSAEVIVAGSFVICLCFVAGWLLDGILKYAGFGVIGNWLSLTLGAIVGLYGFNHQGYFFKNDEIFAIVVVSSSAFVMLCALLLAKRIIRA